MATTETGFALFFNFYICFFFMSFRSSITPFLIQRVFPLSYSSKYGFSFVTLILFSCEVT